ncbi:hypothetical protein [Bartonella sp. DGB1]|uniref:hypothetical protein n=1 Tax=Bartonella sp. DGB1 TaxID=3239807 RepID=UPI0035242D4D
MKKYLYIAGAVITAFFVALAKAFKLGQQDQQNKQDKETLKSIGIRQKVENDINKKSDDNIRDSLRKWVRGNDETR